MLKRITELSKLFDQANRRIRREKLVWKKTMKEYYRKKFKKERIKFRKNKFKVKEKMRRYFSQNQSYGS